MSSKIRLITEEQKLNNQLIGRTDQMLSFLSVKVLLQPIYLTFCREEKGFPKIDDARNDFFKRVFGLS